MKAIRFLLIILSATMLFGCGQASQSSALNENRESSVSASTADNLCDQSAFLWNISINSVEIKETLDTVGTATLYDGKTKELPYYDIPKSGSVFLLLNLTIEKMQPGNSSFDWDKVAVVDEKGNDYIRHENDSFLSNHQYDRIPATSLKMGTSTGWACFEIDSIAAEGQLYLVHQSDEGDNKIQVK